MILGRFRRRIAGEDVPDPFLFRILWKDGAAGWIELCVVAIVRDAKTATLNYATEITDRRHAEDALRESGKLYRQFFRTTRDTVFITTPNGHWIDFNDAVGEMSGYSDRDDVKSISVNSVDEYPEDWIRFHEQVERNGYVREYPLRLRERDGTIYRDLITSAVQKNPDGFVRSFIGRFRDLTPPMPAERALRKKEERYRLFFKTNHDSVFITDFITTPLADLLIGMKHSYNTPAVPAAGDCIQRMSSVSLPVRRSGFFLLEQVRSKGFVRELLPKLKKLNGQVIGTVVNVLPQIDHDGSTSTYIGSFRTLADESDGCHVPVENKKRRRPGYSNPFFQGKSG